MLVHFLFVIFVALGAVLVWRWPQTAWLHIPAFSWGMLAAIKQLTCPLTPLEQRFRMEAGQQGYTGGFIANYIEPLVYPEGLPYSVKMFIAALLTILAVALYWHAWYRRKLPAA